MSNVAGLGAALLGQLGFANIDAWLQAVTDAKASASGPDADKRRDAEAKGIRWERPEGDNRSAKEIIDGSPILKNLLNNGRARDMLIEQVGDYRNDANAAYRAVQVLDHVQRFDESGNHLVNADVTNNRIDGYTSSREARHGTEAGRLQDFGKYGFSHLEGDLGGAGHVGGDAQARSDAEAKGIRWERPEGDDRSAREIVDSSSVLKNLGNQSGVKDALKARVGDFDTDADAAYRAVQVLEHVENFDSNGGRVAGNDVNNGSVDGFTKGGEAKPNTEAGRLQDFGKYGFSHLKGKLPDTASAGSNEAARAEAEARDIRWERPEGDKRSAQEIIDSSPLLKNLGNQSGVKDMLRERVGNFETDADAAYRAVQVLDQIVMYDDGGKLQTGETAFNKSIDGFTKSGEARHGTEAGRLQDFGKYGFERLPGLTEAKDVASYKEFLKANPNADETSKTIARYAAILGENIDAIKGKLGVTGNLTAEDLQRYAKENPQIGKELGEAIAFWSQPGAFDTLETATDPLKLAPDGQLDGKDVASWIKNQAPKDGATAIGFLSDIANANAVANVDTSKLGKDVFEHPENYSAAEKAAVLQELLSSRSLIIKGAEAGMWGDDYGATTIANRTGSHPNPEKVLADLDGRIAILSGDPEVAKFMNESSASQMKSMLAASPGLRTSLQATYDADIKSGRMLDGLWDAKGKDGQQGVLAEFAQTANMYRTALGIDGVTDIQNAVGKSKHAGEFKDFYEKSLVTGDRFSALLKDHSFETAASIFSAEVALYNSTLDPAFTETFDDKLNENFSRIAGENAFKGATFEDLQKAFGVNGGKDLDEAKVKALIEEVSKANPEFFVNANGTVATPDQVMAGFRGAWDNLRQGTKTLDKGNWFEISKGFKDTSDRGLMHGVSGLLMAGVTIAKGANNAGRLTDRQTVDIATGSVQTATLLAEGGAKNFVANLKKAAELDTDVIGLRNFELADIDNRLTTNAGKFENAAKGIGGAASIAAGAYAIFDGVQSIRKGDTVSGALSITSGSVGLVAGGASLVEGTVGLLTSVGRVVAVLAGGLGWLAAGVGVIVSLLPGLIKEGQQQTRANNFGDLLAPTLRKYEIDGVPNGTLMDVPVEDWPGYRESDSYIAS